MLYIFTTDNKIHDINLGVAISTGAGVNSSVASNEMSAVTGVLVTGVVSTTAGVSAVIVGCIGSVTLSALLCACDVATVGISSGGCSIAADASTSSSGALTAVTTKQYLPTSAHKCTAFYHVLLSNAIIAIALLILNKLCLFMLLTVSIGCILVNMSFRMVVLCFCRCF